MQSRNFYSLQAAAFSVLIFASPAFAGYPNNYDPPNALFVCGVILFLLIILFFVLSSVRNALADKTSDKIKWSLSEALSEECELTNDHGEKETKLVASTSRLVAFMGMLAILVLFIGFGTFALYQFAMTGELGDSTDKVVNFLVAGLTLFAPYAVNKFSSLFENIAQPNRQSK